MSSSSGLRVVVHQPPRDGGLELLLKVVQARLGHASILVARVTRTEGTVSSA
jgi:hypothetical protein